MRGQEGGHIPRMESQDDVGYITGRHSAADQERQIRTPGYRAPAAQAGLKTGDRSGKPRQD